MRWFSWSGWPGDTRVQKRPGPAALRHLYDSMNRPLSSDQLRINSEFYPLHLPKKEKSCARGLNVGIRSEPSNVVRPAVDPEDVGYAYSASNWCSRMSLILCSSSSKSSPASSLMLFLSMGPTC